MDEQRYAVTGHLFILEKGALLFHVEIVTRQTLSCWRVTHAGGRGVLVVLANLDGQPCVEVPTVEVLWKQGSWCMMNRIRVSIQWYRAR